MTDFFARKYGGEYKAKHAKLARWNVDNRPSQSRKQLVEDCEVVSATSENLRVCHLVGIDTCATMPKPFESFHHWFKYPSCGTRCYKLHRPNPSSGFACRACHDLTYRSAQKHDARLDRLLKMPDAKLRSLIDNGNGNDPWKRLAMKATE